MLGGKEVRPVLRKLIASMLGDEQASGGVERKSLAVAQSGRVAFRRRETLILCIGVVAPCAGAGFELGAWLMTG